MRHRRRHLSLALALLLGLGSVAAKALPKDLGTNEPRNGAATVYCFGIDPVAR